ncbi:MAG: sensor histidine kinase [Promethearchaeota archaeon]
MREENKRLKEIDDLRRSFISNATHEIKTPLISIYSTIDYILKFKERLPPDIFELIEMAYRGACKLKALIDDMLDVSRLESEKPKFETAQESLVNIINEALNNINTMLIEKGHTINIEIQKNLNVICDKLRIEQVITNLLTNAIKFTPNGGKITIKAKKRNGFAEVMIKDTGIGLLPEDFPKLFKKFGEIKHDKIHASNKGTGLGLYISKEIIKHHGGKIWAESEGKNKGATFIFTIPLHKKE